MRALIIHASVGAGHRRAAESIYNYVKEKCPQFDFKIIDALEYVSAPFRLSYSLGYPFLIHRALFIWRFAFWLTDFKFLRFISRPLAHWINLSNSKALIDYISKENPEFIVSTHFLPSDVAAYLKRKKKITSIVVTLITDFGVHPFWVSKGTDLYVAASEFTREKLIFEERVPEEKIRVFGLPSDEKFLKEFNRGALSVKLGIKADEFTVLLMTGSLGIGPLEDIAELISKDAQVLLVCGANKALYERLEKRNMPNVKVFSFVNNTEELMAVSDLIVTKPGGSSIAEILNMELIPLFISPIPGQESENVKALSQFAIGLSPKSIEEIRDAVLDFKEHPEKIERTKEEIRSFKKPDCLKEICGVICEGSSRPCC